LATLGLPLNNRTVLEVGAGIGDHSSFYIDRGCKITITEGRADNVAYIKTTYPHEDVRILDVDNPNLRDCEKWNIIHCYGLLYHLKYPIKAICFISKHCTDFAILETIAHSKEYKMPLLCKEPKEIQQNSLGGDCYRFSKDWLLNRLKENFKYVYTTKTHPYHVDFPKVRGVFIAAHIELINNNLSLG
jgi:hypothetical protein